MFLFKKNDIRLLRWELSSRVEIAPVHADCVLTNFCLQFMDSGPCGRRMRLVCAVRLVLEQQYTRGPAVTLPPHREGRHVRETILK